MSSKGVRVHGRASLEVRLCEGVDDGVGIAAKFVYPNPLATNRLVLVWAGTDLSGMALTPLLDTLYS